MEHNTNSSECGCRPVVITQNLQKLFYDFIIKHGQAIEEADVRKAEDLTIDFITNFLSSVQDMVEPKEYLPIGKKINDYITAGWNKAREYTQEKFKKLIESAKLFPY